MSETKTQSTAAPKPAQPAQKQAQQQAQQTPAPQQQGGTPVFRDWASI